eukprot:Em0013g245a
MCKSLDPQGSSKNYFVINYKDKPLEFWDASTLTFLRELVSHPPSFKAVEWCPSHGRTKTQKPDAGAITPTPTVDFDVAMGTMDTKIHTPEREYVSVMSTEGDMWQLSVEGSKIKVLSSTPVQTWLSNPQCIAWKGDMMVAGDTEGILTLYDAKNAQGRTLDASKAVVRKIRFAPGKGNSKFFVLCNTKLDIRDINAVVMSGMVGHWFGEGMVGHWFGEGMVGHWFVVVAGSLASGVLSFVCLFFVGINMWFNTTSAFYGPTVIYFLCFFSSVCSVTAMAAYLDFHIWTLRDGVNLVPNMYLYLFDKRLSYIPLASLDWAFYVHAGGVGCSVIAFVLASRLAAVVMSTAEPRASPKNDNSTLLALPPLPESSATISTHIEEDDDSLSELEKQPHFSDQDEASDTAGLQLETTLSMHIEEDDDSLSELGETTSLQ